LPFKADRGTDNVIVFLPSAKGTFLDLPISSAGESISHARAIRLKAREADVEEVSDPYRKFPPSSEFDSGASRDDSS
jgi:hypothetical protein